MTMTTPQAGQTSRDDAMMLLLPTSADDFALMRKTSVLPASASQRSAIAIGTSSLNGQCRQGTALGALPDQQKTKFIQ